MDGPGQRDLQGGGGQEAGQPVGGLRRKEGAHDGLDLKGDGQLLVLLGLHQVLLLLEAETASSSVNHHPHHSVRFPPQLSGDFVLESTQRKLTSIPTPSTRTRGF